MKFIHKTLILIISIIALSHQAFAAKYFIKPDGDDRLDGLSDQTAWKSISKINGFHFSTGDDVYFKCGGVWKGAVLLINWSGKSDNEVIIGSYYVKDGKEVIGISGEKPCIDGNDMVPKSEWNSLVQVSASYVMIQNLRVINSEGIGLAFRDSSHITAKNVETKNTYQHGILVERSQYGEIIDSKTELSCMNWPEYCSVNRCAAASGIASARASFINIRRNTVCRSYGEGIDIILTSHDSIVEDNVVFDVRSGGIYIDQAYNNLIRRNIIYASTDKRFFRSLNPGSGIGVNDEPTRTSALSKNNTISYNLIANRMGGIDFAAEHPDSVVENTHVFNNIIVDCVRNFNVYAKRFNNSSVTHNISIINSDTDGSQYSGPSTTSGMIWQANLWSSAPSGAANGLNDIIKKLELTKRNGWQNLEAFELNGPEFVPRNATQDTLFMQNNNSYSLILLNSLKIALESNPPIYPNSTWPKNVSIASTTTTNNSFGAFYFLDGKTLLAPTLEIVAFPN